MDDFLVRALAAGVGVAAMAGALGCFIVWRRLAYFGDAVSHSGLFGVALGIALGLDVTIGIVISATLFAVLLVVLQRRRTLAGDTLLGILSHGALATSLVMIALLGPVQVDLMGFLFGDILAVDSVDLAWIYGGGAAVLLALAALWRPLLIATVDEDLARVEGVPVERIRFALMLMIALVIAVAVKVVGVLLITSLLIIPAAAARRFARTPEQMAVLAALAGIVAAAGGLGLSFVLDTPSGPSIVVAAIAVFVIALAVPERVRASG